MFREIFLGIITSQCLERDMELCLNFSTKGTKMRKKTHNDFSLDRVK